MSFISLNVRGFGGANKAMDLSRLFKTNRFDLLLMQETMCQVEQVVATISKLLPD